MGTSLDRGVITRFHRALVREIRRSRPEYLSSPFTIAEIYQSLVPYRTHRDRIGVELNGDYEEALLHLLAGEDDYMELDSAAARDQIRRELASNHPNTGIFRDFAAVSVLLNTQLAEEVPEESEEEDEMPRSSDREPAPTGEDAAGTDASPEVDTTAGDDARSDPAPKFEIVAGDSARGRGTPDDCPECGGTLPQRNALRFCPYCGVNVFVVPCGACGEELERLWSYCVACGTPAA